MLLQLETSRKEVLSTIENLSDKMINVNISETTWSIGQVLDHLNKTEIKITNSIHQLISQSEQETITDKPLTKTLDRSIKILASAAITPSTQEFTKQEVVSALLHSRQQLLRLIDTIPPELDLKKRGFKHPVFGVLSLKQWIEFIGYHEKRHAAQITEIKETIMTNHL